MEITRLMLARLASNTSSASALLAAGYSASDALAAGCSASALRAAGCSASALLAAGCSASALRAAGCSASALRAAGCSASALLAAGYSASALLAAGYSASDVLAAGYSASDVLAAGYSASAPREREDLDKRIPLIENPYSKMWADIQAGTRTHDQGTFGPDCDPVTNVCSTAMCTAGHLVQMGGQAGWDLMEEFSFRAAAAMIHAKAHPDWPCQDFGSIRQEWALAYIEEMADWEQNGVPEGITFPLTK